jgi:hypothetical protein
LGGCARASWGAVARPRWGPRGPRVGEYVGRSSGAGDARPSESLLCSFLVCNGAGEGDPGMEPGRHWLGTGRGRWWGLTDGGVRPPGGLAGRVRSPTHRTPDGLGGRSLELLGFCGLRIRVGCAGAGSRVARRPGFVPGNPGGGERLGGGRRTPCPSRGGLPPRRGPGAVTLEVFLRSGGALTWARVHSGGPSRWARGGAARGPGARSARERLPGPHLGQR